MGYTKLWAELITSSIWSADNTTRVLWITMLAMADSEGFVPGSVPGLAAMARMTVEECERALNVLMSPDPHSQSKEFEGRRIQAIEDGGWVILNFAKWHQRRSDSERREYMREYMRRRRASEAVKS